MSFLPDRAGEPKTDEESLQEEYDKVTQFQRLLFRHWPPLHDVALSNCGAITKPSSLLPHLSKLSGADLVSLACRQLRVVAEGDASVLGEDFVKEAVAWHFEHKPSRRSAQADVLFDLGSVQYVYSTEVQYFSPQKCST